MIDAGHKETVPGVQLNQDQREDLHWIKISKFAKKYIRKSKNYMYWNIKTSSSN
jgi:hypothetical protein